jgi:hypothetical protein
MTNPFAIQWSNTVPAACDSPDEKPTPICVAGVLWTSILFFVASIFDMIAG